jgi:hypothetical protein
MWMPGARRRQRSGGSARRSWSRGAARGRPAGGSGAGCHPAGAPGSGGGGPWTAGGRDRDGESGCEFGIERGFAGGDLGEEGRGVILRWRARRWRETKTRWGGKEAGLINLAHFIKIR